MDARIIALFGLLVALFALLFGPGIIGKVTNWIRSRSGHQVFRDVRDFLNQHRYELSEQAFNYYNNRQFSQSLQCKVGEKLLTVNILAGDKWVPENPLSLDRVSLELLMEGQPDYSEIGKKARYLWPYKTLLARYPNYHEAIEATGRPILWENRDTFALANVEATDSTYKLSFKIGKYFEHLDTGEALAYELAAPQWQASEGGKHSYLDHRRLRKKLKYRVVVGSPVDFSKRCAAVGINTLTIFDADSGPKFIMHHRHGDKVALAGEMYGVVPAGEFQPALPIGIIKGSSKWHTIVRRDFDIWRNIMRESNEELLGAKEIPYPDDYLDEPPFKELNKAKKSQKLTLYFLGCVLDPMSLKPDILTVYVFKGKSFSGIFSNIFTGTQLNAEGNLELGQNNLGIPFDGTHVEQYVTSFPTFPAGKACLILAWKHRGALGIKVVE